MSVPKIDELSDEELKEFLAENEQQDQKADNDDPDNLQKADEPEIIDEITILPPKEEKRNEKLKSKEERKVEKLRLKSIKKRKKQIKKNPTTLKRYEPNPEIGLTSEIVEERFIDEFDNKTQERKTKSIPKIILTNVVSFFNIMMFLIAAALIAVGAYRDLVFLVIVTANILIGIVQEIKAKNMIDRLSLMSSPTAFVVRNGVVSEIMTNEVVLDDIIVLETGKQICADSIVVDGSIEVNESLLTGESDAIIKKPGDELLSGSFVVSGKCKARVDKVGKDNYIEKLSSQAKAYKKPKSDLLKSLNLIIKVMSFPVIFLGGALFFIMYFRENGEFAGDIVNCIRKTAGAMIGMIPSGLFLMSSIALMVGVIRLGQKNVLVQELYCIEMLARVNCICLDKTGTITDGTMVVKNVIDYNSVNGIATRNVVSAMLNAIPDKNLTSQALKEKFGLGKRMKHLAIIPFSSQRKLQAVTFDKYGTYILGAPEFVLKNDYKKFEKDVNKYAELGYRVLCLAHNEKPIENDELPAGECVVISMILIEDNIRPDAINTIRYFKESQVEVKVISGDNPITVSKIASRAGVEGADKYISLDGLTDQEVIRAALRYNVFGRVSPKQKQILIKTLKEAGKTVAMTGDGVNDILALREADCSIAVASGSEAARNCSHLVLLDSNFDSMPYVVSEGRRVINNVTKVSSLFLTKTIFSLFLAIEAVITGTYPISTNQLFLIDTLSIGLPSLFLVNEPNNTPVKGRFLYNVIKEALPGALTILLLSIIVFSLSDAMYLETVTRNTIIVIAATHTCLMVLFKACKPFNALHRVICTVCYSLFLFAIIVIPQFLEIRPLIKTSEYLSNDIKETSIEHYPSVDKSLSGIYVVDGKVTQISATSNNRALDLFAVDGDASNKDEAGKIFYSFKTTSTVDGQYDKSFRLDTQVNIPTISYTEKGNIILGGYKITNYNYSNIIDSELKADADGNLYFGNNQVKILLAKSNKHYGYEIKYGDYNEENAIFTANILPQVELHGNNINEFIVDGVESTEYVYVVRDPFIRLDTRIKPKLKADTDGGYIVLVNDKPIYKKYNNGEIEKEPYKVYLPTISTALNKSDNKGTLYLGGIDSNYSIFDLYAAESTIVVDEEEQTIYTLTNNAGNVITYNETTKEYKIDDEVVADFKFTNLSTKGFTEYLDKDNNSINVYNPEAEVSIYITKDSKSKLYNSQYSIMKYNSQTKEYSNFDSEFRTKVSINDSEFKPVIEITEPGYFVIDGYYTNFKATNEPLDPKITTVQIDNKKINYLVLGGVKTDYVLSDIYIKEIKGGTVTKLSLSALIFLLMLCFLASPVMKFFQYSIPVASQGLKSLTAGINKIGAKGPKQSNRDKKDE